MITDKVFPFLDLELFWDDRGRLEFQFHQNKNQLLKYLNKEITQKEATFKAISNGVLNMLAKITSRIEEKAKISLKKNYPDHSNALARAGLGLKNFPTLKELWDNVDEREKKKKRNVKGRGEGNVTLILHWVLTTIAGENP